MSDTDTCTIHCGHVCTDITCDVCGTWLVPIPD